MQGFVCHACHAVSEGKKWRLTCPGCVDQAYFCSARCRRAALAADGPHHHGGECAALLHWRSLLLRSAREEHSPHREHEHLHYLVRMCLAAAARWAVAGGWPAARPAHAKSNLTAGMAALGLADAEPPDADSEGDGEDAAGLPPVLRATLDDVVALMDCRELLNANDWAGHEYVQYHAMTCMAVAHRLRPLPSPADVSRWIRASVPADLGPAPAGAPVSMERLAKATMELLHRVRCNSFALVNTDSERVGAGLFPLASYFNHSCAPTCEFVYRVCGKVDGISNVLARAHALDVRRPRRPVAQQDGVMSVETLTPLAAGAELTLSYTVPGMTYVERHAHLRIVYFFECKCPQCRADEAGATAAPTTM